LNKNLLFNTVYRQTVLFKNDYQLPNDRHDIDTNLVTEHGRQDLKW